jgi:DNA-binding transcriptional LysR family regulator
MTLERVDLFDLEILITVAETGSLGQAAQRFRVTQPAVSMRMTSLEKALGLKVLRRDPSGTRLTPVGEEIVAAARRVVAASEGFLAVAEQLRATTSGLLRLAASFTVAEHLAPAWIEVVRSQSPEVALTLEVANSSQVIKAVESHRVDLGFVEGAERALPNLQTQTVTSDELVIVVSPRHPLARRAKPLDPKELADTELIVRERGSGTREVLDRALAPWGGTRSRLELGSSAALLAAARRGEGPAVLSRLAAGDDLASGRLRQVGVSGLNLARTIRAIWPTGQSLSPAARSLLGAARTSGSLPAHQLPS